MCGGDIVRIARLVNVLHKLLRVAIDQREPRALHLHHDPMSLQKDVVVRMQPDLVFQYTVRRNCFRLLEAAAKASPEYFGCDDELVPRSDGAIRETGRAWVYLRLIVVRVNVNQLHHPVHVRAGGGSEQIGDDVADYSHVLAEGFGLPAQDVGPMIDETLVL